MTQLEQLLQVGVLTGSRAFNCSTPESDWDIVMLESDCKFYMNGDIINDTNFSDYDHTRFKEEYDPESGRTHSIMGYDLSDHEEFEDEPFIEYDEHTIWGPLTRIVKYYPIDSEDTIINLFVYTDKDADILLKFIELNSLMNFLYGHEISNKERRIEAFTKVIEHVGITNFKG